MNHTQTWTDVYGSICARFEGRAGGHRWLVATPPELASQVPMALEMLDGKGIVELLIHNEMTPLLYFVRERQPHGVIVLAPSALASGPGIQLPVEVRTVENGFGFQEGGDFPAWQGYPLVLPGALTGENAAASVVASLDVDVIVCQPEKVRTTLENWMDVTPHGR